MTRRARMKDLARTLDGRGRYRCDEWWPAWSRRARRHIAEARRRHVSAMIRQVFDAAYDLTTGER